MVNSEGAFVSIIIPTFNSNINLFNCIESIKSSGEVVPFEIIVIDDNPDAATITPIGCTTYIKNKVNVGFLESVNIASAAAKGNYLFLLNDDTTVCKSFLSYCLSIYANFNNVACVGAKLLNTDKTIQEAGCYLFNDASQTNYGSGQPNDYRFDYVREVDFCSGAALMIKKSIFFELKGFDQQFSPAYYEETDFQLRCKLTGYSNYYQPLCEVVHIGGSSYNDKKTELLLANKTKFIVKHLKTLEGYPLPTQNPIKKEHLYFIDSHIPEPDKGSGSMRAYNILKSLCKKYQVTFFGEQFIYGEFSPQYITALTQLGVRVVIPSTEKINWEHYIKVYENLRKSGVNTNVLHVRIRDCKEYYGEGIESFFKLIKEILKDNISYVVLARPDIFQKYSGLFKNSTIIYDTVDLHHLRLKSHLKDSYSNKVNVEIEMDIFKKQEFLNISQSDIVWVTTKDEAGYLISNKIPQSKVKVVANFVNFQTTEKAYEQRSNAVFIGSYNHTPNQHAIMFYIDKIIPVLKKRNIKIRLDVIGSNFDNFKYENDEYLNIVGYVEDTYDYFNNALFALYPLQSGAGMKGKVNQAISMGVPIVTSEYGAQGFDSNLFVLSTDADSYVTNIYLLLNSKAKWEQIRNNEIRYSKEDTFDKFTENVLNSLNSLAN